MWGFFFQEDCTLENAWNMGGLSILTSAPPTPPSVCFLCASKGQHEVTAPHICFIFIECVKFKIQECFFYYSYRRCCIAKYAVSPSTSFASIQRTVPLKRTRKTGAVVAASFATCAAGKTSPQRYSLSS